MEVNWCYVNLRNADYLYGQQRSRSKCVSRLQSNMSLGWRYTVWYLWGQNWLPIKKSLHAWCQPNGGFFHIGYTSQLLLAIFLVLAFSFFFRHLSYADTWACSWDVSLGSVTVLFLYCVLPLMLFPIIILTDICMTYTVTYLLVKFNK